ncbi:hypothetical protein ACFYR1_51315 [Streptomyces canus]|uniref:hypothetical protein n=1 Tax=Streptomyces canus TaxID=58343 RepID=UPI0036BEA740
MAGRHRRVLARWGPEVIALESPPTSLRPCRWPARPGAEFAARPGPTPVMVPGGHESLTKDASAER